MKGKKCLLFLSSVLFVLLLPVAWLAPNANAVRSSRSGTIQKVGFRMSPEQLDGTLSYSYQDRIKSFTHNVSGTAKRFSLNTLSFVLDSTMIGRSGEHFYLDFYFKTVYDSGEGNKDETGIFLCVTSPPTGLTNLVVIDDCSFTSISDNLITTTANLIPQSTASGYLENVVARANNLYVMRIKGHFLEDVSINGMTFSTGQPFYNYIYPTMSSTLVRSITIQIGVGPFVLYYPDDNPDADMNEKDNQDRADMQNASDTAQSDSDSSGQDAENQGQTLLAGFSSFVGALNSSTSYNCNIDFNIMGYLNGGQVDLCELDVPPQIQAISSIVLIGFCVPLSIATARKVISLFRSFQ